MRGLILAGGFGTRLRGVVSDLPKPMAPIQGKPFLTYLLETLNQAGFTEITLSLHFMAEKIQRYYGNRYANIDLSYLVEEEPLGTGGAITFFVNEMRPSNPFFVLNGDTYVRLDYQKMYNTHIAEKGRLTMALSPVANCSRYGEVIFRDKIITSFDHVGTDKPGLINAGVYLINSDVFSQYELPASFSFEKDFLYRQVDQLKLHGYVADDYFIDIGIPDDYQRANRELPLLLPEVASVKHNNTRNPISVT